MTGFPIYYIGWDLKSQNDQVYDEDEIPCKISNLKCEIPCKISNLKCEIPCKISNLKCEITYITSQWVYLKVGLLIFLLNSEL